MECTVLVSAVKPLTDINWCATFVLVSQYGLYGFSPYRNISAHYIEQNKRTTWRADKRWHYSPVKRGPVPERSSRLDLFDVAQHHVFFLYSFSLQEKHQYYHKILQQDWVILLQSPVSFNAVADPGFLRRGAPTYFLAKFSPKTAWKWKKLYPGGAS